MTRVPPQATYSRKNKAKLPTKKHFSKPSQVLTKYVFPCYAPAPRQDLGPQEPGMQCCLRHLHGRGTQGQRGRREEHHPEHQAFPRPGNDKPEDGDSGDREGDHGHLRRRRRDRRDQGRDRESVFQPRVPRAHSDGKCQGVLRGDGKVLKKHKNNIKKRKKFKKNLKKCKKVIVI